LTRITWNGIFDSTEKNTGPWVGLLVEVTRQRGLAFPSLPNATI
jgi:hypothetical protein